MNVLYVTFNLRSVNVLYVQSTFSERTLRSIYVQWTHFTFNLRSVNVLYVESTFSERTLRSVYIRWTWNWTFNASLISPFKNLFFRLSRSTGHAGFVCIYIPVIRIIHECHKNVFLNFWLLPNSYCIFFFWLKTTAEYCKVSVSWPVQCNSGSKHSRWISYSTGKSKNSCFCDYSSVVKIWIILFEVTFDTFPAWYPITEEITNRCVSVICPSRNSGPVYIIIPRREW